MLFVLIALPIAWSCEKEEEEVKEKGKIPEGWTRNDDLSKLGENSWYLYRSGNDSIKIEFEYYTTLNRGSFSYDLYKKNNKGIYNKTIFSYLNEANSVERNGEKVIFGQGYYEENKDYSTRYELVNNKTVIIYNLPGLKPFNKGLEFKAVTDKKYNDKSLLKGGWYHSEVVDSTVMVFEEENIKEYLFVRGSSTIRESWEYGDYTANSIKSYLNNEHFGTVSNLKFEEYKDDNCSYNINGDNLTIYWKSPRKAITYQRINN